MIDYSDMQDKIFEQLTVPYVYYAQNDVSQKIVLASYILKIENELLLLPSANIFSYPAILAGLNEKQIEYIAKNAPKTYKQELAKSILTEYRMKEVFEIAKAMDEDLGEGVAQNQKRIRSVYRYISDNWAVFQF